MLGMDYCIPQHTQHKYAASTMSSETLSGSCDSSRSNRIRTIRLVRPNHWNVPPPSFNCRHGPSLGFSIRGGREHGTGFFVSHVEPGSEAHRQGLKIGDQIIRVNGFTIDDAVHKEVLQLISNHTHLTLKVRGVGMIPVKENKTDALSWQIITDNSSMRSSPPLSDNNLRDVRLNIIVAPKSKLGCGICKGPDWKPGIFVQFTKEGGIAREAGLRPGDQIISCNSVDFTDIAFKEAVNIMKSTRQLDIIVRKSAGSELFPGESSGYNSSASSVTGDQSPSWSDSKRLSIVKEENLDLEDRLTQLDRLNRIPNSNKWESFDWDETEYEQKQYFKPTIINLSENGTTIKNNGRAEDFPEINQLNKNSDRTDDNAIESQQQHDTKTVVVDVHRSDADDKNAISSNNKNEHNPLTKSSSTSSFASLTSRSSNASSSLSSAICQEIQRRQKNASNENKPSIDEQLQVKKILKGGVSSVSSDKQQQHNKLMDEFKKAHQRMFKPAECGEADNKDDDDANENCKRIAGNNISNNNKNNNNGPSTSSSLITGIENMDRLAELELSQRLSERLNNLTMENGKIDNQDKIQSRNATGIAPPPPPPPPNFDTDLDSIVSSRSSTLKPNKLKGKAPPVPVKYSTLSFNKPNQPPPCPTPDYDTLSIASSTSSTFKPLPSQNLNNNNINRNNESVEMDSMDSFKMNNPSSGRPKPPNTYFQKPPLTGSLSVGSGMQLNSAKKVQRPVSITIGEYPTLRKQPGKLNFLHNGDAVDGDHSPITSQFASELAQTLNRSNLRKRTESVENLFSSSAQNHIKTQSNGSVRISLNSSLAKNLAKSTNDLSSLDKKFNRVTINVNPEKKVESPQNGILKNSNYAVPSHKPLVQQKSITFGELPIIINDQQLVT